MMVYERSGQGVADLILLFPAGGKASLCIEMKVPKHKGSSAGKQSAHQQEWQVLVESHGSVYVVCHGIIEFVKAVLHLFKHRSATIHQQGIKSISTIPMTYIDLINSFGRYTRTCPSARMMWRAVLPIC